MRVAVFGGTFNPVHYGHLRLAEEAREICGLDRVVFMPTFITPHKLTESLTPAKVRFELVKAAIEDNPGFSVSDIEIRREGRSFTVDTVRELLKEPDIEVFLILGSDSFNDIASWYEYEELLNLASFIVAPRPNNLPKPLEQVLPVELASKFWYDSRVMALVNSCGNSITYLDTTPIDISSSEIRERVGRGRSVRYLLPDSAIEFIRKEGLYR
ncbi:MAG: nicotinate-nucleotide adenylyltransferase [Deltaproteobacteria bacterium]|nr:nicotinate-nucleotide adenylyltransferase [Deltaproteobacteria bacterium]